MAVAAEHQTALTVDGAVEHDTAFGIQGVPQLVAVIDGKSTELSGEILYSGSERPLAALGTCPTSLSKAVDRRLCGTVWGVRLICRGQAQTAPSLSTSPATD